MGVDYYKALQVPRTSGIEEITESYEKLATRWNPDNHPNERKALTGLKFEQISEAYEVLSNPTKRRDYDRLNGGEQEGVKYYETQSSGSSTTTGTDNAKQQSILTKVEPIEYPLYCTLEELYNGPKNYVAFPRFISHPSGMPTMEERVITIQIEPGWKKGTKVTFLESGNQQEGLTQGDLIFVIDEEPHSTFTRDGDDLLMTKQISLDQTSLTGKTFNLTTLDGRNLTIDVRDVIIEPGHEVVIIGEGMPISKQSRMKGNLRITFELETRAPEQVY